MLGFTICMILYAVGLRLERDDYEDWSLYEVWQEEREGILMDLYFQEDNLSKEEQEFIANPYHQEDDR